MKFSTILPLAATAAAIVLPEDAVMQQIAVEKQPQHTLIEGFQAQLPSKHQVDQVKQKIEETFGSWYESSQNVLDDAFTWASERVHTASDELTEEFFDAKAWLSSGEGEIGHPPYRGHPPHGKRPGPPDHPHDDPGHDHPPPPPPPPPPHHDDPHHEHPHPRTHDDPHHPPHHGRPPHHRKPHHKSNHTVYELINSSKYTTKLAKLINKDADLVKLLNGTSANFTVFAPTDAAFDKIPDHHKEPSKELIKKILSYHVSSEFYPAGRILVSRTVPTLLEGKYLSTDPEDTPQRISTNIGLRGLTLNFYSRVVAANIFGRNGVIHGIDSFLLPPPNAARIVTLLPSEFSTLELGLHKTGLFDTLNSTSNHLGGTVFAPSNWAFTKLGPRVNAFLFSEYGRKYLKALLEYHIVANQTLYSDAFYSGGKSKTEDHERHRIPRGHFHVDLETTLQGKYLSIDIGRFGRLIDIRINGFNHVSISDGVAKDGVIHVVSSVIIPPKKVDGALVEYQGEDLTVEDLKERLGAYVENDEEKQTDNKHDL